MKLKHFARWCGHAYRIIDVRTPEWTWTLRGVTIIIIKVSMAFSITRVGKFNNMAIMIHYTNGIIYLWTYACCITGIIIAISCTLGITPVIKLQYSPICIGHTYWFINIRTEDRTRTWQ